MHIPFKDGGVKVGDSLVVIWHGCKECGRWKTHPPTLELSFLTTNPGCLTYADHQAINLSNFERNHVIRSARLQLGKE